MFPSGTGRHSQGGVSDNEILRGQLQGETPQKAIPSRAGTVQEM